MFLFFARETSFFASLTVGVNGLTNSVILFQDKQKQLHNEDDRVRQHCTSRQFQFSRTCVTLRNFSHRVKFKGRTRLVRPNLATSFVLLGLLTFVPTIKLGKVNSFLSGKH